MAAATAFTVLSLVLTITSAAIYDEDGERRDVKPHGRFNYFDVELLKAELAQNGHHNVVVSPASAKAVLAMLHEGAGGPTAHQIGRALRLDEGRDASRKRIKEFLEALQVNRQGLLVEVGNAVFASPETKVPKEYQEVLKEYFLSSVETADFSKPHVAAATINNWVTRHTRNFIRSLIDPQGLNPGTKAIVVNALFFKGKWTVPFDKNATTVRCFYVEPQKCRYGYFMETLGYYNYAVIKGLNAEAVEVPYQGNKFSMIFLKPTGSIEQMVRDLSYVPLNAIIEELESTNVYLSIPRFSIEYEADLVPALQQLGIKDIFQPTANLSGIIENSGGLYISNFLQKTIIEVTEEGTRGASATGAIAIPLMGPTIPKFQADKPFLFFLRDLETGNFLFQGLVEQPELAKEAETKPPLPSVANGASGAKPVNSGATVRPQRTTTLRKATGGTDQGFSFMNQNEENSQFSPNYAVNAGQGVTQPVYSTVNKPHGFATPTSQSSNAPSDSIHYPHI